MTSDKTFNTYCPVCDTEVSANLVEREETTDVRGETITFAAEVAICPCCGKVIGDSRIESKNLNKAFDIYRKRHDILTVDCLKELRVSYGLSLRDFSKFLGFGEQTYARYERGSLPNSTHNQILKTAMTPSGAKQLLSANGAKLSEKAIASVWHFISNGMAPKTDWDRMEWELSLPINFSDNPSAINGYQPLNFDCLFEIVYCLAEKCQALYWTKLQKALFFVEQYAFDTTSSSIAGLQFAHGPHGPMMNNRETIRAYLVQNNIVDFCSDSNNWGEIVIPKSKPKNVLSKENLEIIDFVASFINTFHTTTELSNFSHELSAWANTSNGDLISYDARSNEVMQAIKKRLQIS